MGGATSTLAEPMAKRITMHLRVTSLTDVADGTPPTLSSIAENIQLHMNLVENLISSHNEKGKEGNASRILGIHDPDFEPRLHRKFAGYHSWLRLMNWILEIGDNEDEDGNSVDSSVIFVSEINYETFGYGTWTEDRNTYANMLNVPITLPDGPRTEEEAEALVSRMAEHYNTESSKENDPDNTHMDDEDGISEASTIIGEDSEYSPNGHWRAPTPHERVILRRYFYNLEGQMVLLLSHVVVIASGEGDSNVANTIVARMNNVIEAIEDLWNFADCLRNETEVVLKVGRDAGAVKDKENREPEPEADFTILDDGDEPEASQNLAEDHGRALQDITPKRAIPPKGRGILKTLCSKGKRVLYRVRFDEQDLKTRVSSKRQAGKRRVEHPDADEDSENQRANKRQAVTPNVPVDGEDLEDRQIKIENEDDEQTQGAIEQSDDSIWIRFEQIIRSDAKPWRTILDFQQDAPSEAAALDDAHAEEVATVDAYTEEGTRSDELAAEVEFGDEADETSNANVTYVQVAGEDEEQTTEQNLAFQGDAFIEWLAWAKDEHTESVPQTEELPIQEHSHSQEDVHVEELISQPNAHAEEATSFAEPKTNTDIIGNLESNSNGNENVTGADLDANSDKIMADALSELLAEVATNHNATTNNRLTGDASSNVEADAGVVGQNIKDTANPTSKGTGENENMLSKVNVHTQQFTGEGSLINSCDADTNVFGNENVDAQLTTALEAIPTTSDSTGEAESEHTETNVNAQKPGTHEASTSSQDAATNSDGNGNTNSQLTKTLDSILTTSNSTGEGESAHPGTNIHPQQSAADKVPTEHQNANSTLNGNENINEQLRSILDDFFATNNVPTRSSPTTDSSTIIEADYHDSDVEMVDAFSLADTEDATEDITMHDVEVASVNGPATPNSIDNEGQETSGIEAGVSTQATGAEDNPGLNNDANQDGDINDDAAAITADATNVPNVGNAAQENIGIRSEASPIQEEGEATEENPNSGSSTPTTASGATAEQSIMSELESTHRLLNWERTREAFPEYTSEDFMNLLAPSIQPSSDNDPVAEFTTILSQGLLGIATEAALDTRDQAANPPAFPPSTVGYALMIPADEGPTLTRFDNITPDADDVEFREFLSSTYPAINWGRLNTLNSSQMEIEPWEHFIEYVALAGPIAPNEAPEVFNAYVARVVNASVDAAIMLGDDWLSNLVMP
ncbi:uncharacterized protein DSM5745_03943 [Aspergillus mulundensis]|uniref:Uncharacterized protein n=1 Tax=Aspergillus mulundensis TaxID=1810919 RepID=A0A3D8SB81_9EURO|nr:hypothetical protein DSM5745_03943 [Aspergillus mulundensis]RDW83617.1 hypothetical protein DSM5745_03943 [Aspergillus mulundensis]